MRFVQLFWLLFGIYTVSAQDKSGDTWVLGEWRAMCAGFTGTTNPILKVLYDTAFPGVPAFPYYHASANSNICDRNTGRVLFSTNGMRIIDSTGGVMMNSDSLQPLNAYTLNSPPLMGLQQQAIILPKGNAGQYYVFIPTVSDTTFVKFWNPTSAKSPFDMIIFHIVDMNLNNGKGAVIEKNRILIQDHELHKTGFMANRHANGRDWWLIKQGGYNKNEFIRFLVTADSIYGPYIQNFVNPEWLEFDKFGQLAFSSSGEILAAAYNKKHELFIADFDRCTGELSNSKVFKIPLDSTTIPNALPQYVMDSIVKGVCFSTNDMFLYVSRRNNIYQFEYNEPDSSLAWIRIKHGPDTIYQKFQYYGSLFRGIDNKIYIGNEGGTARQMSVIDFPDLKGTACGFCRKCFRSDTSALFAITAPPNLPDFNLAADTTAPCWWPLQSNEILDRSGETLLVYPNPASTYLTITCEALKNKGVNISLYNMLGQVVLSQECQFVQQKSTLDIQSLPSGVYILKVGDWVRRVEVE